jgi:DNA-3-methyladenine glycosylase II
MSADPALQPATKEVREAVQLLYGIAPKFKAIEKIAGPLTIKCWSPTFASLVRVVVGQQLSTKAAAAIFNRLQAAVKLTPEAFLRADPTSLSEAGLSRSKINTCLALAKAMTDQKLAIKKLTSMEDDEVRKILIEIKGIGPWTADIFLLFCLGRLNAWPHSDLGLQLSYQSFFELETRPDSQAMLRIGEELHPVRGAAAYLLWHYYRHAKSR